jgi:uncharacterized protein YecE (DUF72 family)
MHGSGIHIGTSGWSYRHWSGVFYPPELKPDKYLEYYQSRFSCVELNASFYHLPREITVTGWMMRTPETFVFCPKMSRFVTHRLRLKDAAGSLERFFTVFAPLKLKTGPVLMQLPPSLTYDPALTEDFFSLLTEKYTEYRFAWEIRHASWLNAGFFNLLNRSNMGFVIADSGRRFPYHEAVTASFVYIRLHGREQLYASDYQDHDLSLLAQKIIGWHTEKKEIWVFFNNDFHGFAVKNAERLHHFIHTTVQ